MNRRQQRTQRPGLVKIHPLSPLPLFPPVQEMLVAATGRAAPIGVIYGKTSSATSRCNRAGEPARPISPLTNPATVCIHVYRNRVPALWHPETLSTSHPPHEARPTRPSTPFAPWRETRSEHRAQSGLYRCGKTRPVAAKCSPVLPPPKLEMPCKRSPIRTPSAAKSFHFAAQKRDIFPRR